MDLHDFYSYLSRYHPDVHDWVTDVIGVERIQRLHNLFVMANIHVDRYEFAKLTHGAPSDKYQTVLDSLESDEFREELSARITIDLL